MFCPRCGTENHPGASYCIRCGMPLGNIPDPYAGQPVQQNPMSYGNAYNSQYPQQNAAFSGQPYYSQPYSVPAFPYPDGAVGTAVKSKKKKIILISVISVVAVAGIVCAILIPILLAGNALSKQIVGTWKTSDNSLQLTFTSDGKVITAQNDQPTEIDRYFIDDRSRSLTVIDSTGRAYTMQWNEALEKGSAGQMRQSGEVMIGKAATMTKDTGASQIEWYLSGNKLYVGDYVLIKQ